MGVCDAASHVSGVEANALVLMREPCDCLQGLALRQDPALPGLCLSGSVLVVISFDVNDCLAVQAV